MLFLEKDDDSRIEIRPRIVVKQISLPQSPRGDVEQTQGGTGLSVAPASKSRLILTPQRHQALQAGPTL